MIDIRNEKLMTLREACDWLPRRSRGRKVALSTLWRWSKRGVQGIRLEVARIGRSVMTSQEPLQRFSNKLVEHKSDTPDRALEFSQRNPSPADDEAQELLKRSGW